MGLKTRECLLPWPKGAEATGGEMQTVCWMLHYLPMLVLYLSLGADC